MNELHLDDAAYWPEGYRRPWHIVNFNAWRHQHVKPPWWVFAESSAIAAQRQLCMRSINSAASFRDQHRNFLIGPEWDEGYMASFVGDPSKFGEYGRRIFEPDS